MTRLSEDEVVEEYSRRFGALSLTPSLDYGQAVRTWDECIELARTALDEGRPIPWHEILKPLPPGAES